MSTPKTDLATATVLVAGLGITGKAVAEALTPRAKQVRTAADDPGADAPMPTDEATSKAALAGVDLVVTSPGIPPTHPLLAAAAQAGIPIWSEVELAWQLRTELAKPAKWLCITGTNGKTTTVGMLESILRAGGEHALAVGNVGTPLITAALDPSLDVLAVELSSFQLNFTHSMAAQAAAILNIAPDHIDWHGSLDEYANAKGKIYQGIEVAGIYNVADPQTEHLLADAEVTEGARAVGFTLGTPQRGMVGIVDDLLVDRAFHLPFDAYHREKSADELATFADLAHLGAGTDYTNEAGHHTKRPPDHILANALAAAALARAHGVPLEAVRKGLQDYQPGGHRIAKVAELDGVTYVNDSKATNAHAAAASLKAFPKGTVVWIVGGLAKGATFDELVAANKGALRAAVVIGKDQKPFTDALSRHASEVPVLLIDKEDTDIMGSAVKGAMSLAQPGDTVLLAPAGASQDQFKSYAHRGDSFISAVEALGAGGSQTAVPVTTASQAAASQTTASQTGN
ncbi:MAG: UDP-N-acetylmuramoyl-L-alanine--D-glutamate ligase [Cellulomonadaceae bacterium]|nr:UDP-N-acetylmuramoyl-L-alanine--D-glutamate ligase [Cellulomonadaceae bacterium]